MLTQMPLSTSYSAALATLRERLDLECTETDAQGRYVLDWDAMSDVIDAVDEIEKALTAKVGADE